jgi:hypothetical protein
MKTERLLPLLLVALCGCAPTQYIQKGTFEGVEVSYRWNHPTGKPSELLLKMTNTSVEDKQVDLVIDLQYQGRTVGSLRADTCIRVGQTMNGKLNGIYFVPEQLTTEQIKSGDATAELTNTTVEGTTCP